MQAKASAERCDIDLCRDARSSGVGATSGRRTRARAWTEPKISRTVKRNGGRGDGRGEDALGGRSGFNGPRNDYMVLRRRGTTRVSLPTARPAAIERRLARFTYIMSAIYWIVAMESRSSLSRA